MREHREFIRKTARIMANCGHSRKAAGITGGSGLSGLSAYTPWQIMIPKPVPKSTTAYPTTDARRLSLMRAEQKYASATWASPQPA